MQHSIKSKEIIILSSLIGVFICVIFFGGWFLPKQFQSSIEKHDIITLDYQAWLSDSSKNYDPLSPIFDEVLVITVIPISEDSENGLILGLYNDLIGKGLYYESDLIWLDKCIDQNHDGIDDISGDPALSYGNSTDQYFNTYLMIQFKILGIENSI